MTKEIKIALGIGIALVVLGYLLTPGFLFLKPRDSSSLMGTGSTITWFVGVVICIGAGVAWFVTRRQRNL